MPKHDLIGGRAYNREAETGLEQSGECLRIVRPEHSADPQLRDGVVGSGQPETVVPVEQRKHIRESGARKLHAAFAPRQCIGDLRRRHRTGASGSDGCTCHMNYDTMASREQRVSPFLWLTESRRRCGEVAICVDRQ